MKGLIIKINSDLYTVKLEDATFLDCKCRGKFRNDNLKPLVGDKVLVNTDKNVIEKVYERKNELIRPSVANIDKLIIVVSTSIPKFSSFLLDKFLVIAYKNDVEPVIVITKMDLISNKLKKEVNKYIKYYKKIGYKVYKNSEIRKIKKEFNNSVVSLMGQTGAGKSTLLNKLDKNLNLKTNEVSKSLGRGKHTTRIVELHPILNGMCADTPGFSSLELYNVTKEDIKRSFIEFDNNCKYKTCMHIKEDGCKVIKQKQTTKDEIFINRYNNYIKLLGEVENGNKRINSK